LCLNSKGEGVNVFPAGNELWGYRQIGIGKNTEIEYALIRHWFEQEVYGNDTI